jgi:hypothetical protein
VATPHASQVRTHQSEALPWLTSSRTRGADGQRASIISITRGVHDPPQRPVVALVLVATSATVRAPASIALSIVPYLMLLQRQTVVSFLTAGWRISLMLRRTTEESAAAFPARLFSVLSSR